MSAQGNMIFIDRIRQVLLDAIERDRNALEANPDQARAGHCRGLRAALELIDQEYRSITGDQRLTEN